MKKLMVSLVALSLTVVAQAAEVVWTGGGADNKWSTVENWSTGALPGTTDFVVFRPAGDLSVSVKNADGSNLNPTIGGLRFESGNTMTSGGYFYTSSKTTEVFVAENATAKVDDTFDPNNGTYWFKKTGKGLLNANVVGADYKYAGVILEEGPMTIRGTSSKIKRLVIRVGQTLTLPNHNTFGNLPPAVEIEKGGLLYPTTQGGSLPLKSLEGEGTVDTAPDNSSGVKLVLTPSEDVVFNGKIGLRMWTTVSANSTGRFILGNANVLGGTFEVNGSRGLGFAPGVGTFNIATVNYTPDADSPLHLADTEGNPVSVIAAMASGAGAKLKTTGPGNFYIKGARGMTLTGSGSIQHTGLLGNKVSGSEKALTLGDGTEANDFDFSTISGLDAAGGEIDVHNAADFVFDRPVTGNGVLALYPPSVLSALNMTGGRITVHDNLAVTGGDATLATGSTGLAFAAENKTIALTNVSVHGEVLVDANQGIAHLPTPWGTIIGGDKAGSRILVGPGADLYVNYLGETGVQTLEQDGGSIHFCGPYQPLSTSTAQSPSEVLFNGGTAWMMTCKNYSSSPVSPFIDKESLAVKVGARGVMFRTEGALNRNEAANVWVRRPILSGVTDGTDGGLRQYGFGEYQYDYPMTITGPYFAEGSASVVKGTLANGPFWFGTGAVTLRNHQIAVADQTTPGTLKLSSLAVDGGGYIVLRDGKTASKVDVEIGSLSFQPGSALFLRDGAGVGTDGAGTVKVAEPVETAANGRVLSVFGTKSITAQDYLAYDADKGFVPLTGVVEANHLSNTDRSKAVTLLQNQWGMDQVGAGQTVAAESLMLAQQGVYLRLLDNVKLLMGCDGKTSALVLNDSTIEGRTGAYIDFGDSEALIVTAGASFPSIASYLRVNMKGSKGVSYVAKPYLYYSCFHAINVSGTNTYAGVTRIGAVCVYASSDQCFSTGDVHVSGGECFGGQVRFNCEGGVWNNNFHIAGLGVKETLLAGNRNCGAMSFNKSGTVAGNVELVDFAQLCATGGFTGTISGSVSGDRLRVLGKSGAGVIALTGSNTYTGGTEVVEGVLALGRGDSAGTGEIVLNGGTLRFINDQPITFANAITGVGKIEIAGTAPVTFTGTEFAGLPLKMLAPGTVFDFPTLANASYVAAVTADGLDLGGNDLTVDGLYGAGTVKGGTLTVTGAINPGGEGAIGTIVFETMPVLAGATLVAEVSKTGIDGISLPGDVDLSALALKVVDLNSRGAHLRESVITCTGVRTGAFASVTLPAKRPDRFELSYGASSADLSVGKGMLLLVR